MTCGSVPCFVSAEKSDTAGRLFSQRIHPIALGLSRTGGSARKQAAKRHEESGVVLTAHRARVLPSSRPSALNPSDVIGRSRHYRQGSPFARETRGLLATPARKAIAPGD
jgi:hypothetical protein